MWGCTMFRDGVLSQLVMTTEPPPELAAEWKQVRARVAGVPRGRERVFLSSCARDCEAFSQRMLESLGTSPWLCLSRTLRTFRTCLPVYQSDL